MCMAGREDVSARLGCFSPLHRCSTHQRKISPPPYSVNVNEMQSAKHEGSIVAKCEVLAVKFKEEEEDKPYVDILSFPCRTQLPPGTCVCVTQFSDAEKRVFALRKLKVCTRVKAQFGQCLHQVVAEACTVDVQPGGRRETLKSMMT